MKIQKYNCTVLNAADKFSKGRGVKVYPTDLTALGEIAGRMLNDKHLEISKVRPFFWTLVETYADRFNRYPFDFNKALLSQLELADYPEEKVQQLVAQIESEFQKIHGRALRPTTPLLCPQDALDEEIKKLRDSLRYAAMVAETNK